MGAYLLGKPYVKQGPGLDLVRQDAVGEIAVHHEVVFRVGVHGGGVPCGEFAIGIVESNGLHRKVILALIVVVVCPRGAVFVQVDSTFRLVPDNLYGSGEHQFHFRNVGDKTEARIHTFPHAAASGRHGGGVLVYLAAVGCAGGLPGTLDVEPCAVDVDGCPEGLDGPEVQPVFYAVLDPPGGVGGPAPAGEFHLIRLGGRLARASKVEGHVAAFQSEVRGTVGDDVLREAPPVELALVAELVRVGFVEEGGESAHGFGLETEP